MKIYLKKNIKSHISTLSIHWSNGHFESHSDRGFAEDNTFNRDWDWVEDAILRAYNEGYLKGKQRGRLYDNQRTMGKRN